MKMYRFWFACLVCIISLRTHAAETAALVSDVSGNVTIDDNGSLSVARLLAPIPSGAKIDLATGAKLSMIFIAKGEEYKLSGPGHYQLEISAPKTISGAAPSKQESITGALKGIRVRVNSVTQASVSFRSIAKKNSVSPLNPIAPSGCLTLAEPLQLRWQSPAKGLMYKIQIFDNQDKLLLNRDVMENLYTVPMEIHLISNETYSWKVTAILPDGSPISAPGHFKVASNEIREQAAKLKPEKNQPISERIAYGLWLESNSLVDEAYQVWMKLADEYPDEPNIRLRANYSIHQKFVLKP